MSIFPLPVFEAEADPQSREAMNDEEIYARLKPPKTIVVKFGSMKLVGEFNYDGDAKPGCGSKLVARTHRGTELVEMLTTTCSNSGCSKSVTRQEMLEYIENSGGREYPFHTNGRVIRVASIEDLNTQADFNAKTKEQISFCKALIAEMDLPMKLVDVEPILGGELLTFYYMAEERVDFRELVKQLASRFSTRIEMRQVGARDEARLVADYERCGQHCCCKTFLKLLKPVSMRLAKEQKATLDTLKISGRCGRLMCCLRYEDATYADLKSRLPRKGTRVGTSEGPGVVVDTKILVQLVLVRLEHDATEVAVPVEELMSPEECPPPGSKKPRGADAVEPDPLLEAPIEEPRKRPEDRRGAGDRRDRRERGDKGNRPDRPGRGPERSSADRQDAFRRRSQSQDQSGDPKRPTGPPAQQPHGSQGRPGGSGQPPPPPAPDVRSSGEGQQGRRRRRRRRRGRGGSGRDGDSGGPSGPGPGPAAPEGQ